MFCTNCGKENPDDKSFCSGCGHMLTKSQASQIIQEETKTEELKAEEPVAVEEPKTEEPVVVEEPKAEEPVVTEESKIEEPVVEDAKPFVRSAFIEASTPVQVQSKVEEPAKKEKAKKEKKVKEKPVKEKPVKEKKVKPEKSDSSSKEKKGIGSVIAIIFCFILIALIVLGICFGPNLFNMMKNTDSLVGHWKVTAERDRNDWDPDVDEMVLNVTSYSMDFSDFGFDSHTFFELPNWYFEEGENALCYYYEKSEGNGILVEYNAKKDTIIVSVIKKDRVSAEYLLVR